MTTAGKDNLTRDEARERARLISDLSYDINLDLTTGDVTFGSDTSIRFKCGEAGASTFIDWDAVEVDSIELNGVEQPKSAFADGRVTLDGLEAQNVLRLRGTCEYSRTGTGLHRMTDPVDKQSYAYTQFEPFDAHRVIACFDQPDLKGTFAFDVNVPDEWVVISNNRPVQKPDADKGGRWVFGPTPVMSTYLAALCVGPFKGFFDKYNEIELGWWVRDSLAKYVDADELFEITKQGFEFYEREFDYPYMLDSYDQVFCPEYKFGAMENLGCVTYAEGFVFRSKVTEAERERRAEVILHEMSHMWFGDLVTMKWWNDLWLNESFATYMSYLAMARATRFKDAFVGFASGEKTWAYRQDQMPTTHPIVADIPDVEATHLNFDGITYAKGASVLKQLVAWVGEEAFFKGLRRYFKKHEYGNTELPDFLAPLAEESGRDLAAWSKEWLETSGVNSIRVDYNAAKDKFESVTITQDGEPLRSHRMGLSLFDAKDGTLEMREATELDVVGARTAVADLDGEPVADLVLPNHADLAYMKIRFDDRSLHTLTEQLRDLTDPLARTLCWGAAFDMLRDAELPARRYVELVLNNIDGETDIGVVRDLLLRTTAAVGTYGDPSNRDALRAKVASACKERMTSTEPGSDLQLVWTRYFIGNARDDADLAQIRGLLDGTESVDGLVVDTDLRWAMVSALAHMGAADDSVISAEVERDPTDQGERYAAAARAARPSAEAKAEAWEKVTNDPEITLAMIRSVIGGFQTSDQEELREQYGDRFFGELLSFWNKREFDLGLAFTGGMYPKLYRDDIVKRTDKLIADPEVPAPMRRLLIEAKDETERVIRTRAKDASV